MINHSKTKFDRNKVQSNKFLKTYLFFLCDFRLIVNRNTSVEIEIFPYYNFAWQIHCFCIPVLEWAWYFSNLKTSQNSEIYRVRTWWRKSSVQLWIMLRLTIKIYKGCKRFGLLTLPWLEFCEQLQLVWDFLPNKDTEN